MNGTWFGWGAVAVALALSGVVNGSIRATILVALAGAALVGPRRWRVIALVAIAAIGWGGWRVAAIDRAAAPLGSRTLKGEAVELRQMLPAHRAGEPLPDGARAVVGGRTVVVSIGRYARTTPALQRGSVAAVDGRLIPLTAAPSDRRLARQGVAGRVMLNAARDTGRRRGGALGLLDSVARNTADAAARAGGDRAGPLLVGMALGIAEAITPADRDALRAAGLWHLAAASGGNVALVIALCFAIGWIAGLPDRARVIVAIFAVGAYVPLAGGGPSIQRAGVMGIAALGAMFVGRTHRTADALGLAAAATLLRDPRAWLDVGWQLSFVATAALLLAVQPLGRRLHGAGCPRRLALPLATTVIAATATAPIMLLTFGSVSAAGLLTNIAAAPLAAITVWSGALTALATAISPALAYGVALPGVAGAHATLWLAAWGASRSHAQLDGHAALLVCVAVAAVAVLRPRRALVWALVASVALLFAVDRPRPPGQPRLVVLDIGQGSAALLQAGGEAILVDAGPADGNVVAQLRRAGVRRLRALILSHPAADHDDMRRKPVERIE
ncbi:MAG: ComEC/Rec2 family competence protein, partial [Patulibacter sp.]